MTSPVLTFEPYAGKEADFEAHLARFDGLNWDSNLGPQGPGGKATSARTWKRGEPDVTLFGGILRSILGSEERAGVPKFSEIDYYRAWASSTPAGVPIESHAHDGQIVLCCFFDLHEDPAPLEFLDRGEVVESIVPTPGLTLIWPSGLEHRVPEGEKRDGDRLCMVANLTLRST